VQHRVQKALSQAIARRWFLARSSDARRRAIVRRFAAVESSVRSEHTPKEMLVVADYVLTAAPAGPLVECGCYLGGSTAKLSILASMTGRRLYVCDSFQGLPEVTREEHTWSTVEGVVNPFARGQYAVTLEAVRANVQQAGALDVCEFVPGFFSETLPQLDVAPALVFADADLVSSTRDTLKHLWPRLVDRGRWYTHDANIPDLVSGIMDARWWLEEIGECPPVLWGAGYGCGFGAGGLAYAEKRVTAQVRASVAHSI
jgi:O-methyltransferase